MEGITKTIKTLNLKYNIILGIVALNFIWDLTMRFGLVPRDFFKLF